MKFLPQKIALIACSVILVILPLGAEELPPRTPDGRFGTKCYKWLGKGRYLENCQISFFKLIASAERYHNKLISISGFLVAEDGQLRLYPGAYNRDDGDSLIIDYRMSPELLKKAKSGIQGVRCVGVFDGKFIGGLFPALGRLYEVQAIIFPKSK